MERKKAAGVELLKLATELDVVKSVRDYLDSREGEEFRLLPEQLGLTDESLNSGISKYNEMVLRRGKLLLLGHGKVTRSLPGWRCSYVT